MPQRRNDKDFNRENLQWLYHTLCYNVIPFQAQNFVFPSIRPNYALYGWKKSTKMTLFPNEDPEKHEEMTNIFSELKKKGLFSHTEVKQLELHYHAISKWSHVAEIIVEFKNAL